MSSIVIKIGSLVIKSLSKPIAAQIKLQAREHERFRNYCINIAQRIHRWDMRFRLGLLQDQAAIDKQIAQEAAERAAQKHKHPKDTVKTEAESKADEEAAAKGKEKSKEDPKPKVKKPPKIRPLSEAKAIDSGANFVSETFLLVVAVACVIGERYYSSRKESNRREDVADRLEELEQYEQAARRGLLEMEREIIRLRTKAGETGPRHGRILPKEVYEMEEKEEGEPEADKGWFARIAAYVSRSKEASDKAAQEVQEPEEIAVPAAAAPPQPTGAMNKLIHSLPFPSTSGEQSIGRSPQTARSKTDSPQRPQTTPKSPS